MSFEFTRDDYDFLLVTAALWDIDSGVTKELPKKYQGAEVLLHEVAHAMALGLDDITTETPYAVGDHFDLLNHQHALIGLYSEAYVFAVEANAQQHLGWSRRFSLRPAMFAVWKNGIRAHARQFSFKDFQARQAFFRKTPSAQACGKRVADWLINFVVTHRDAEQAAQPRVH